MAPSSVVSHGESLPSQMHSPAPTGARGPLYFLTVLLVDSLVEAILPAPTPPGDPVLPPFEWNSDGSVALVPMGGAS